MFKAGVILPGTGTHSAKLISEPGLYKLIQSSRKPDAQAFDRWVRHEVLPSIRKTGSYSLGAGETMPDVGGLLGTIAATPRLYPARRPRAFHRVPGRDPRVL